MKIKNLEDELNRTKTALAEVNSNNEFIQDDTITLEVDKNS